MVQSGDVYLCKCKMHNPGTLQGHLCDTTLYTVYKCYSYPEAGEQAHLVYLESSGQRLSTSAHRQAIKVLFPLNSVMLDVMTDYVPKLHNTILNRKDKIKAKYCDIQHIWTLYCVVWLLHHMKHHVCPHTPSM